MKMLIGGQKVDASDGKTIDVINPANGKFVDTVPAATKEDIDRAVELSKQGQKEWQAIPLTERCNIMQKFLRLFEENKIEVLSTLVRESGKNPGQGIFEFDFVNTALPAYFETAKRFTGEIIPPGADAGTDANLMMVTHVPLGTIAAIVPFNASVMLMMWKVAPALAAGNAVIVKPATDNPLAVIICCIH